MTFYSFFKYLHSGFRYIVLILLLIAMIQSVVGWLGKKPYTETARKINLFALVAAHTQLLIGIVLYFLSPLVQFNSLAMKDRTIRYFTVEHWVMMIIALIIITIGHSKSKKKTAAEAKYKTVAIAYIIAFVVIIFTLIIGYLPIFGSRG
jgi:hypothetical protein